jgi:hypothetical protein
VKHILDMGIPAVVEAVDQRLDLHCQLQTVVYNFGRFLIDHPSAPVLIPQNFSPDSWEYEVLSHIHAIVTDDEMYKAQCEIYDGDQNLMDEIDDPPQAEFGTLLNLVENVVYPKDAHLHRADVWAMIAAVEPRVHALAKIKSLLEPLVEEAAL